MKIYFSCRKCKSKCLVIVDLKLKIANIYSNNAAHNHASIKRVKQQKFQNEGNNNNNDDDDDDDDAGHDSQFSFKININMNKLT